MSDTYKRFLVVAPAWVGDAVMSQVLLKKLKKNNPLVKIDVLALDFLKPLFTRMPEVNDWISMPVGHGKLNLKARLQVAKWLKDQYSHAFVLPNSFKSALIPYFAKIPQRIGWLGECRFGLLTQWQRLDKAHFPTMIARFAALAEGMPIRSKQGMDFLEPYWPALNCLSAAKKIPAEKVLALCPGAEYGEAKRWPVEHYGALARSYLKLGWQVQLLGGSKDKAIGQSIARHAKGCTDLTGKTSLDEAIDLLACATVVVTNDSGLMHVSCAVGTPVVAVYGSSSPLFTPPLSKQCTTLSLKLPCSPCFARRCRYGHTRCLTDLSVARVQQAIENTVAMTV